MVGNWERVVVGVDDTAPSEAALRWALAHARRAAAPIVLVHVVDEERVGASRDSQAEATRTGEHLLREAAERIHVAEPGLATTRLMLRGSLFRALAEAAGADDLLVIGTHKTGYLHGRVLGSRGVRIAAAAPGSVAVIPDIALNFRRGVVAGVDRVSTAPAIARAAADEAASRGDELLLVHTVAQPDGAREGAPQNETIVAALRAVREAHPTLVVRARVAHRDPAEALLDAARDRALLVLGPGSPEGPSAPIGSVLHDVLLNVTAPVLVARSAAVRDRLPSPGATA